MPNSCLGNAVEPKAGAPRDAIGKRRRGACSRISQLSFELYMINEGRPRPKDLPTQRPLAAVGGFPPLVDVPAQALAPAESQNDRCAG